MKSLVKLVLLLMFAVAAAIPAVRADVPQLLAWQGVALDSNNVPVTDSTYGFTFRIYDDGIGGSLLWQESQLVTTENGVLNVLLGTNNPIPDSVFEGATCYLEVQFGAEPPYTPRTQIVSVGYAYRVSTVDGSYGGVITGDIHQKADSSYAGFYLHQQFAPTLAGALTATANGGTLQLFDGNGAKHTDIFPDPADGDGGWFVLYSDNTYTRGFEIFDPSSSPSQNNPAMFMVGDSSTIYFSTNASGDASVELPVGAINASEMFNEPGLASGPQNSGTITTTQTTAASASATFPASGYVVVICEATFRANTSGNWITGQINENGGSKGTWWWDPGDVDGFYDQRQTYVYTGSVTAGTKTYDLQLILSSGTADYNKAKVTVMYFPTMYGTVNTPTATSNPDAGQFSDPVATQVDVEAEREASIQLNQKRIADELAAMKERMIQLEAQLKQTSTAQSDRR